MLLALRFAGMSVVEKLEIPKMLLVSGSPSPSRVSVLPNM